MISCSSYSRRVMSPFGVVQFAIHLIMCPFLHCSFFYLVQSRFVVFLQPFLSHILCLWLSLDFSQTDKLISFIHTWSFSLLSPRLDFSSPLTTSFLPVGWPWSFTLWKQFRLERQERGGLGVVEERRGWWWCGGVSQPTGQTFFLHPLKARHLRLASY